MPDRPADPQRARIPRPTVKRLSLYLRELDNRTRGGAVTVSSRELGDALGLTDAQVRKDLACFGQLGHAGIGYRAEELRDALRSVLGIDRRWPAIVVGVGNIGRAVLRYPGLRAKGFDIVAACDADPAVVGTTVGGVTVAPIEQLDEAIRASGPVLAFLAVPADAAQEIAERLVAAGIAGILNFAPVRLAIPPHVAIVSVDVTVSLEQLAFKMLSGTAPGE